MYIWLDVNLQHVLLIHYFFPAVQQKLTQCPKITITLKKFLKIWQ